MEQTCRQLKSRIRTKKHKNHIREHYNTGRGASLQKEINFADDIHQETDARTQLADGYGGVSQGLPPDYRQVRKSLCCCHV